MLLNRRQQSLVLMTMFVLLVGFQIGSAQVDEGDGETDPIKLFERGQNAHAKGEVQRALALYEAAIKLRPEFPEAEYQRGIALIALDRLADAEKALSRAIELKKDWALPYSSLGNLLARLSRDKEAEPLLRHAIQLGNKDFITLDSLATVLFRAGDKSEALEFARRATEDENASASAWAWRATLERDAGKLTDALDSIERALKLDPKSVAALRERAALYVDSAKYDLAIGDLNQALSFNPGDKEISLALANAYQLANRPDEARRIYESVGYSATSTAEQAKGSINVNGSKEDIDAANSEDPKIAGPALEKLIASNPKNAGLYGRLGEVTRRSNPVKGAEAYRRANELDPKNAKYATGYAAALIQARRFAEAVAILQQVIYREPDDYVAHANLALALYEQKRFAEALPVYEWLAAKRPEIAATYFFIATAHDNLAEYEQALDAYEKFLSHADAVNNRLDIEKVNLRLPALREQIKKGQGVKRKKP